MGLAGRNLSVVLCSPSGPSICLPIGLPLGLPNDRRNDSSGRSLIVYEAWPGRRVREGVVDL